MARKIMIDKKRECIADVAAKVFSEKGYQVASLQDIAKKAKLSKAGLYHYFKSKDEILAYILIQYSDLGLAELNNCIQENKKNNLTPQSSFRKLVKVYSQIVNRDKERRLIVLRERHQLTGNHKRELLKKEQAIFHILKNELEKIGTLKKNIDYNVITFLSISMVHWVGYWYKEGRGLNLTTIIDQNIEIIFNGILKKE